MEDQGLSWQQKGKVFALFLLWTTVGLYLEIPGPTMIDIRIIYTANYEDVASSISGRGAGGFVGALLGGFLVDKFAQHIDLQIALAQTVASVAVLTVPFSFAISFVFFHYFTLGLCGAIINIAGIRSIILLAGAGDKTSTMLLFLHIGYGLGSLLVPVIVNPFLATVQPVSKDTLAAASQVEEDLEVLSASRVQYAFVLIGIISFVLGLLFYYFHCQQGSNVHVEYKPVVTEEFHDVQSKQELNLKPRSFKDMINPSSYADGSFGFGLYMFIILSLFYFTMSGGEEAMGNFVRSFSVDMFQFNKTEASYLNMTFWLSLTVARVVMSIISNYVTIKKLFKLQVLFYLFTSTLLFIYASQSSSMLWLCTILQGFAVSPLYPGGIAYGNTQMDMTGVCLMVIGLSGAFGDMTFMWLTGKLYDTMGPTAVLGLLQLSGVVLTVCVVLFRLVERSSKDRETKTPPKNPFRHVCPCINCT